MWVELCFRTAGVAGSKQTLRQGSRPPPEDASGSKPATAWVVGAEQATKHFARHEEALDVLSFAVENPAVGVGFDAAEREGDAASDPVGVERAGFDGGRPIALDRLGCRGAPVFDIGVESDAAVDRVVEVADSLWKFFGVDADLGCQFFESVGNFHGYAWHV